MAEPRVTVVFCTGCRRSDDLSLQEGRFWCGWCQRWADVEAERVIGAAVVLDGDHFRLVPPKPAHTGLQPIRVHAGWRIDWNTLYEEDPTDPANANGYYHGGTNLFLAANERARQCIDIAWSTEPDNPAVGRYLLQVLPLIDDAPGKLMVDWDAPLHEFETTLRPVLVAELERWLCGLIG